MKSSTSYAPRLTDEDVRLIAECKAHRQQLRRQASELSDASLARKFGVSEQTIHRVPSA